MTVPRINRTTEVSTVGGDVKARGPGAYRGDEISGERGLLERVQTVWNLWGVRVIGKWLFLRVRHSSDVRGGRILVKGRVKGGGLRL